MKPSYIFSILLTVILAACKSPITPQKTPEELRDTVHALVSARITTFGMNNVLWSVQVPDTLSIGRITSKGTLVEKNVLRSSIDCFHNINPTNTYISLTFTRLWNLSTKDYIREDNQQLEALRSWYEDRLRILMIVPPSLPSSFTTNTLRAFTWQQYSYEEVFRPVSPQTPTIWAPIALPIRLVSITYDSLGKSDDPTLDAQVDNAQVIFDQYDTEKRRVSGRFSFTIRSRKSDQFIEIKDGRFENVYLRRFSD